MLEARVFTFGILADDGKVDILVAAIEARQVLDERNRRVNIQVLSHGHIKRRLSKLVDWRIQNA